MYEVKKAGTTPDPLHSAWFVSATDLDEYRDDEKVYYRDADGRRRLRMYKKGTFVYRLQGRDREKSASYYTPESLTRCVVKHTLNERIADDTPADEILRLTVCEPAMGSAAFLNEAVNQLAERYLQRKQRELRTRIEHEDYPDALQRVRHYIADRNVYGVDLNPMAVELAEVSLWLNCIHRDGHVPWFGYQLTCGNSLVGARRQVYPVDQVQKQKGQKKADLWFNHAPDRVNPAFDMRRPESTVYHFLLPDHGMASYKDKAAKALEPAHFTRIGAWRKTFCKAFSATDAAELERLSDVVDKLWNLHVKQLARDHLETEDTQLVWGQPDPERPRRTPNAWKDRIRDQGIFAEGGAVASPYRRLKLVMDYWCALWFWPIAESDLLPSRDEFLDELSLILTADARREDQPEQIEMLFGEEYAEHGREMAERVVDEAGMLDLAELFARSPRLSLVDELAARHRFHHWELHFADVFYGTGEDGKVRGGFDVVLGNPPWVKVEWKESGVLGDYRPLVAIRKYRAARIAAMRSDAFEERAGLRDAWFEEMEGASAMQAFLNAVQNHPFLRGQKANLYKCFVPRAWMITGEDGVAGLLHPEGVYDDPSGGVFREALYPRLRSHYQFLNELKLFEEVDHHTKFSVNVYGRALTTPRFKHIANLFAPATVDACLDHNGQGPVPGIKDDDNKWNTAGHSHRIVKVDVDGLAVFATLYDAPNTPARRARLPALHAETLLRVLRKLAAHPLRLGDLTKEDFTVSQHWNETIAQRDGTIRRRTRFPETAPDLVFSGPHFFVGNPSYKTPRRTCTLSSHYDVLDLTTVPDDYLPRTNYIPACTPTEYARRTPRVSWIEPGEAPPGEASPSEAPPGKAPLGEAPPGKEKSRKVTDYYRVMNREMVAPAMERTLIPTLIPREAALIHTNAATAFRRAGEGVDFAALTMSTVLDFFIKSTGTGNVNLAWLSRLPLLTPDTPSGLRAALRLRTLLLNCLTIHYAELWDELYDPAFISRPLDQGRSPPAISPFHGP